MTSELTHCRSLSGAEVRLSAPLNPQGWSRELNANPTGRYPDCKVHCPSESFYAPGGEAVRKHTKEVCHFADGC